MLDIVITHYNEPWFICRKQFQMLEAQRIVNWNEVKVTVVNDGGQRLPDSKLAVLPFHVEQINIGKSGISASRNAGMDNGKEPWIMFCDCDDCFTNIYALDEILSALRKPGAEQQDMMWTDCLTEFGRLVTGIPEKNSLFFVHGKAYRKQFLLDSGIRFDESMTYGEDTQFNLVLSQQTDRIAKIETSSPPYVWIRRGGSVTTRSVERI